MRRARTAQRHLKKAKQQLEDLGEITDWEDEFITSVDARLDEFGAAFADRTKGGAADALSMRQKQVLAQMRRKIKDKGKQAPEHKGRSGFKPRSSFKNKSNFKPRVRHIEDDMCDDEPPVPPKGKPKLTVIKGGKK